MSNDLEHRACFDEQPGPIIKKHVGIQEIYGNEVLIHKGNVGMTEEEIQELDFVIPPSRTESEWKVIPSKPFTAPVEPLKYISE